MFKLKIKILQIETEKQNVRIEYSLVLFGVKIIDNSVWLKEYESLECNDGYTVNYNRK